MALLPPVAAALRRHRASQQEERLRIGAAWKNLAPDDGGLIFTTTVGTEISGDNLRNRSLRPLLEEAGLPALTFHELRHSTASFLPALDVHPALAMAYMGHASIKQTMDTYTHVTPEAVREVAEKLGQSLFTEALEGGLR